MGILKNMIIIFGLSGIIIAVVALIIFVLWCAILTISMLTGKDFTTSIFITIGVVFLISLFTHMIRGKPFISVNKKR